MLSNRRSSLKIALLFAATLVFSSQAFAAPAASGFTVTDALGRRVEFKAVPKRIVITGKSVVMVADAMYLFPEASSRLVAIGNTFQGALSFPQAIDPGFGDKAKLDNSAGPEQIAPLSPDAVVLKSALAGTQGKAIEALGVPVVYVNFETPAQYESDLALLGALFQNEARAKELIAAFQARVDRVAKAVSGIPEAKKPRALMLYYNEQGGSVSFNVPPVDWIQTMLVRMGGGRPVWDGAQLGKGWTKVSIEQVASWDPDQVFVISYQKPSSDAVAALKADPQWASLGAVKKGAVFAFPCDYYSWDQPDARWVLGLEWLAAKLNPEQFQGLDMKAEIRSFYRDFYAMDDAAYKAKVEPYLGSALR